MDQSSSPTHPSNDLPFQGLREQLDQALQQANQALQQQLSTRMGQLQDQMSRSLTKGLNDITQHVDERLHEFADTVEQHRPLSPKPSGHATRRRMDTESEVNLPRIESGLNPEMQRLLEAIDRRIEQRLPKMETNENTWASVFAQLQQLVRQHDYQRAVEACDLLIEATKDALIPAAYRDGVDLALQDLTPEQRRQIDEQKRMLSYIAPTIREAVQSAIPRTRAYTKKAAISTPTKRPPSAGVKKEPHA
jgi:hypothetical protein